MLGNKEHYSYKGRKKYGAKSCTLILHCYELQKRILGNRYCERFLQMLKLIVEVGYKQIYRKSNHFTDTLAKGGVDRHKMFCAY